MRAKCAIVFAVRSQMGNIVCPPIRLATWPSVGEWIRIPGRCDARIEVVMHLPELADIGGPSVELICWLSDEVPPPKRKRPPGRPRKRSPPR